MKKIATIEILADVKNHDEQGQAAVEEKKDRRQFQATLNNF